MENVKRDIVSAEWDMVIIWDCDSVDKPPTSAASCLLVILNWKMVQNPGGRVQSQFYSLVQGFIEVHPDLAQVLAHCWGISRNVWHHSHVGHITFTCEKKTRFGFVNIQI